MTAPAFLRGRPFAHRGLHDHLAGVPENSVAAVDAAVRARLGVEVDVRLCRDGTPVVFHDARLERLCGVPARVAETTYDDLRRLRLADSAEPVPTLRDVLACVAGAVPVLVDLKCGFRRDDRESLAAAVARELRRYGGPAAAVSFDPLVLRALAAVAPEVPRGQSGGVPRVGWGARGVLLPAMRPVDRYWLNRLSAPHFVTFNVDRLPFASLQAARLRGVLALGWTVRQRHQLSELSTHVDNVIVEGAAALAAAA